MAKGALRVVVVGGGAAGFFGAIAAATACPEAQVQLLEAGRNLLSKVQISGGGRCNVTHHCFDPALLVQNYPRGSRALRGPFSRFQPRDTVAWFAQRGVRLKTEADGRMFPTTDDSATIIDCLQGEARRVGVEIHTQTPVVAIAKPAEQFQLQLKSGQQWICDRLLLATGSSPAGYRLAASLGHTIMPPVPSLFTFNVADPHLHALAGVAVDRVAVSLSLPGSKPLRQEGPLLITHWGFSGPAVLKLSAWGARLLRQHHYQATLTINWQPEQTPEALRLRLLAAKQEWAKRQVASQSPFPLTKRLWQYLVQHRAAIAKETTWANLAKKQLSALVHHLSQDAYPISGKGSFKEEFVTCGGVSLPEVNFKTLESRCCSGLFFAGEILDIDGITGGFNFQNAWTTSWIAGRTMAQPAAMAAGKTS